MLDNTPLYVGYVNLKHSYAKYISIDRYIASISRDTTKAIDWIEDLGDLGGKSGVPVTKLLTLPGFSHPFRIIPCGSRHSLLTKYLSKITSLVLIRSSIETLFPPDSHVNFVSEIVWAVNLFKQAEVPIVFVCELDKHYDERQSLKEFLQLGASDIFATYEQENILNIVRERPK